MHQGQQRGPVRHTLFQDPVGLLERRLGPACLLIEPGIVEGQRRLAGEGFGQRQVARPIALRPRAAHTRERAQHPAPGQEGHDEFGLEPQGLQQRPMRRIPGLGVEPGGGDRGIAPGLPRAQHAGHRVGRIQGQERILLA